MLKNLLNASIFISLRCYCVSPVNSFKLKMNNAICRISTVYPVQRISVPNDKVSWQVPWPDYAPPNYSAPYLSTAPWADPDINNVTFKPNWNDDDNGIDRKSYNNENVVKYDINQGYPQNPVGRTGLNGRGRLGRWGPNHAGDAIVTRWKTNNGEKELSLNTGQPILQFIAILRKDCGKWAIPGGFVDPKEASSAAVLRELFEEAINIGKLSSDVQADLKSFFKNGKQIYRGYVDDPRNTDNAWIETTAITFHDESGKYTEKIALDARDDAMDVTWIDVVPDMSIYPPHYAIIDCLKEIHKRDI